MVAEPRDVLEPAKVVGELTQCESCQAENEADALYCANCGIDMGGSSGPVPYAADAADTVVCPGCGLMNDPSANNCDQCGAPMKPGRSALPRDNLVRAVAEKAELRTAADGMPTLYGHFARFDQWNEIDSPYEGTFLERISPGAFKKTFQENAERFQILFQHGRDPVIGDKPLAKAEILREDAEGPYYEGQLLDTSYNRDLLPGLAAGVYGASYRFSVMREDIVTRPEKSDYNPDGLPERTIKEARVMEAGPVTFPADPKATAGVRSLTDWYRDTGFTTTLKDLTQNKPGELARLIEAAKPRDEAPSEPDVRETPVAKERRADSPPNRSPKEADVGTEQYRTKEEKVARLAEIKSKIEEIGSTLTTAFDDASREEFNNLKDERVQLKADLADMAEVERTLREVELDEGREPRVVPGDGARPAWEGRTVRDVDPYDVGEVYASSSTPEEANRKFRDNAMRSVEISRFPMAGEKNRPSQEDIQGHVSQLLDTIDGPGEDKVQGELARRIVTTGSPAYKRAYRQMVKSMMTGVPPIFSAEEQRAMSVSTTTAGGFAVVYQLDPTIIPTSNWAVNPYRAVCTVKTISGTNEYRGVTAGSVTATYRLEGAQMADNSPTLAQPAFVVKRCDAFVPFSYEIGSDWESFDSEMAKAIQDGKDENEATQFTTGVGTTVFPQGITVGATNTATTGTTTVLAINDVYKTEEALAPRFRPNAQWFSSKFWYNKVRQFDTAGGAGLFVPNLRLGLGNNPGSAGAAGNTGYQLLGYQANEASAFTATLATTVKEAVLGNPEYYYIIDRIGMNIELIPQLFQQTTAGTGFGIPTGQRGLVAYWRNTARVLDPAGFVTLVGA